MVTYVPMLRWKRGERKALKHVRAATKANAINPYVDVSADRFRGKTATKRTAATTAPDQFIADLLDSWGRGRVYVAAATLLPEAGSTSHPIREIATRAKAAKIAVVPATERAASPAYQAAVLAAAKTLGSGVCLKISLDEMTSASSWVGSWPVALTETDLVVDLGNNVANVLALGSPVVDAFRSLHKGAQWRSVACVGTSMPDNFQAYAKGLYEIPRKEWTLWKKLNAGSLPYDLDYGDYCTVALTTPPAGIKWGYPITVKYTLKDDFLICRGVRTTGAGAKDSDVQLVEHAKDIVAYAKRGAISGCWADDQINQIAAGKIGPSGLEHWVTLAVNRHFELVRGQLP